MGFKRDINKIECYVDLDLGGNNSLLNRVEIYKKMSQEIKIIFKKYGFDHQIEELGGMGGGGGLGIVNTLLLLIKIAWEHKDIIGLIIAVLNTIFGLSKHIYNKVQLNYDQDRPKVKLSLGISTKEDWEDSDLNSVLGRKLVVLKHVSDEICLALKSKYPLFDFNQSYSLFIKPKQYLVSFDLPAKYNNSLNRNRIINLFKKIIIKQNRSTSYSFSSFMLIKRDDSNLIVEDTTKQRSDFRRYYLFFSANILSDYR